MIFLYFLNHSNLTACFWNIFSQNKHHINTQNKNFPIKHKNFGSLSFLDVKICRKNGKFVTSAYMKPVYSRIFTNYEIFFTTYQNRGLYTHYWLGFLAYVVTSIHFIWKSIIWRLSSGKTTIILILLIRVLSHFLINCIHPKLLFWIYFKKDAFLSCCSLKVLLFKSEWSFKSYLLII